MVKGVPQEKKRLVLIDAHAILHRAYHALPEFSNSKGEPTGGLYGLASMLIKIIGDLKPDFIAAAYDLPKPTFRHEAYKEYKAGRAKADDALVSQMIRSREIFECLSIPIYDKEGFEADDVLGTIVHQVKGQKPEVKSLNLDVVIASGDMDTLQLVDDKRVQVFTLRKGIQDTVLYDEEAVRTRFGFGPEILPDFKGLRGDPSDNIKGVRGIGDKTATELVKNFGTIENIYKQLKIKNSKLVTTERPRVLELLKQGKEDAEFSKLLATIRTDVPITFTLPPKSWRETVALDHADHVFRTLEFRALSERLKSVVMGKDTPPVETPSPRAGGGAPAQATLSDALESLGVSPHELKETAVALWLVNSNLTNPTLEDIYRAAGTNDWTKAREFIAGEIRAKELSRVFEEIERPLIPVIERMNARGILIDVPYLCSLSKEYHRELARHEKEIWNMAGREFNVNSPKQLGEILFTKLGLKAARQKKTSTGALSTRESELEKLRDAHPIIGKILEYREFAKLLSTYIDPIPNMVAKDGRLHAEFLSAGSTTGRMASQNPNLQNIPIQTELGRRIRNAFTVEPGWKLLSFDYSQIELRIAAILSGDRKLIDIFKRGEDVHTAVAAEVFNVSRDQVTKEMRRQAKVINFGILYGMGVNSLRQALSEGGNQVSREEAQSFFDEYFADFYELAGYLERTKLLVHEKGYTETLFGRRRYHEAIRSSIPYIRAAAERTAINAPIQGTGADIIKLAMVRVDDLIRKERLERGAHLLLQVHDELVYEVREEHLRRVAAEIQKIMEQVLSAEVNKGVPILAEVSSGANWGEMSRVS